MAPHHKRGKPKKKQHHAPRVLDEAAREELVVLQAIFGDAACDVHDDGAGVTLLIVPHAGDAAANLAGYAS